MEKARAYQGLGDYDAAIQSARQALDTGEAPAKLGGAIGNGSFLAREFIGAAFEKQGLPHQAVEIYRESMQVDPHYLAILGGLSRALLMSGEPVEKVMQEVEPYLAQNLPAAGAIVATRIYERGEIEAALSLYRRVEQSAPGNPIIRVGLVECLLSQGELDQALELCTPLDPSNPVAHVLLRTAAFCYILQGNPEQAEELLSASEEIGMSQDESFVLSSWIQVLKGGEFKTWNNQHAVLAAPLLESVLKLQQFDAAQGLIRLYYNAAISIAERTLIMAPIYARQGFLNSAAECWLEWIDQDGPQADSLVGLAYISRAEERYEEALALAQDAVTMDPGHEEAQRMAVAFAQWS
jgi:tetratricopeptide (TPR) repeat protein